MAEQDDLDLSRRRLLAAAGLTGLAAALPAQSGASVQTAPPDPAAAQPIAGLHLQFGADASAEMTASCHSLAPV